MKILLHVCCAPCSIYPLEQLRKNRFEADGLFYNPNIHGFAEFVNRKNALIDFSKVADFEVIISEYKPEEFFACIGSNQSKPGRCALCWSLRLKKTAQVAKEKKYSHFSSTLLVSPYQDHTMLKEIGLNIAREEGVEFYYEDFRPGFKDAQAQARAKNLYMQKYCGCIYSEVERAKEKSHV